MPYIVVDADGKEVFRDEDLDIVCSKGAKVGGRYVIEKR